MCMMKNSGEKEACEVANNLAALDGRVNAGFDAAHKVPIAELGVEIDATDAARFFDGL